MRDVLARLGIESVNPGAASAEGWRQTNGPRITVTSPIDGQPLADVQLATVEDYEAIVTQAQEAFGRWRVLPAPKRGEIVRAMGDALREHKDDLGRLVTNEVGKLLSEGLG
ncbi:MAG: aldehyde dehydrogenase family protein, partial [Myxococcota bacterium]